MNVLTVILLNWILITLIGPHLMDIFHILLWLQVFYWSINRNTCFWEFYTNDSLMLCRNHILIFFEMKIYFTEIFFLITFGWRIYILCFNDGYCAHNFINMCFHQSYWHTCVFASNFFNNTVSYLYIVFCSIGF